MEQGRYHRQPLRAKEVLRLYAAGERDFRGTILRGGNFRNANLSGADFTGADIRSARFVNATLHGVNFSHARAGLQRHWWIGQLGIVGLIAALSGFLQALGGGIIGRALIGSEPTTQSAGIAALIVTVLVFFILARQGFTLKAMGSAAFAFAFAVPLTVVIGFAFTIVIAFAFAVAVAGVIFIAVAVAVNGTLAAIASAIVAVAIASTEAGVDNVAVTTAVTVAVASFVFSLYINRCIHRADPRFENLRIIGLAFAALGGTAFSGADLTEATFAQAGLKSTNFADSRQRPTTFTRVRWHGATKLARARLGTSNLQNLSIRTLLTTLQGSDQDFSHADLRGANLAGAQLHRANLTGANLNRATLQGAELQGAQLWEAQCLGTDLTQADLTGACIEAWNTDSSTCLQAVQCDYIYLLRDYQERRPNSGTFQPGEFTQLFQEVLETIDLIFQNGIDWKAFTRTFQQVQEQHQETGLSVQSIEAKGAGAMVVKLNAGPEVDRAAIHQEFSEIYQVALKEAEARYKAQLEAKDDQISEYRQQSANMQEVMKLLASRPVTVDVTAIAESKSMQGNDHSRNVKIGGDFNATHSNVTLNLGEISGEVTNQIGQLPDGDGGDQPSLKDLLSQLKAAIDNDGELDDDLKAEALTAVGRLATVGANPNPDPKTKGIAQRATAALKGITDTLSDTSKLATAVKSLLPLVLGVLAL